MSYSINPVLLIHSLPSELQDMILETSFHMSECGKEKSDILTLDKSTYERLASRYYRECIFCFQDAENVVDMFLNKASGRCLQNTRVVRIRMQNDSMGLRSPTDLPTIIRILETLIVSVTTASKLSALTRLEFTFEMAFKWVYDANKPLVLDDEVHDLDSDDSRPWFEAFNKQAHYLPRDMNNQLKAIAG